MKLDDSNVPAAVLSINDEPEQAQLLGLVEVSHDYAQWVKVVMLRILVNTSALDQPDRGESYALSKTGEFLGFENFAEFCNSHSLLEVRRTLTDILTTWELQSGSACRFPRVLQRNLDALAALVGLNEVESDILGLCVLIREEAILRTCCDLLGERLEGRRAARSLAPMLSRKVDIVDRALQRSERLAHTGLLSIEMSGQHSLNMLIGLMTSTFSSRMITPQRDIRAIIEGFLRPAPLSKLKREDFEHVRSDLDLCLSYLGNAIQGRKAGINILIYGSPGTGKTELARVLATELKVQMMEVNTSNLSGAPVAPMRRINSFQMAQSFFSNVPALVLFDECEEAFGLAGMQDNGGVETIAPRKSWINKMLETNEVPTIWIANSLACFDPSHLRRFSICCEMPIPSQKQRKKILEQVSDGNLSESVQDCISRNKDVSPAVLTQVARVLNAVAPGKTGDERDGVAMILLNNALKVQRKTEVSLMRDTAVGESFNPAWVNSDADLEQVRDSIFQLRGGRLCLWGPPGTGKTAFGKWIAQSLDVPHLVYKGSDLLSPYLGETERSIAQAFEMARKQNAVLQFDEVDSFLRDRQLASKGWEVTQVNEMLTQMESFQGVFIASTNLFKSLDEASLRRFDMTIKFDYSKPEPAWSMFLKTCDVLGIWDTAAVAKSEFMTLENLAPGDFDQIIRRARLLRPSGARDVLRGLQAALCLKKADSGRPIGFLRAA